MTNSIFIFLCLAVIHRTDAVDYYEAIFEIASPSSSKTLLFSNNNEVFMGSTSLSLSPLDSTPILATFTMTELTGNSSFSLESGNNNDNSSLAVVVSQVCQGSSMFLFQNPYTLINECRNCTQCKAKESLIASCTITSDTLCTRVCPLGSVSKVVAAGEAEQCTLCPAGKFAPYYDSGCQDCNVGYYSRKVGQSSCLKCAEGMTTSLNSGFEICLPVRPPVLFKYTERKYVCRA